MGIDYLEMAQASQISKYFPDIWGKDFGGRCSVEEDNQPELVIGVTFQEVVLLFQFHNM